MTRRGAARGSSGRGSDEAREGDYAQPSLACRSFAASMSCGAAGVLTDDVAMFMFTSQQSVRMDATLHTVRASLLASDGLIPPAGVPGPDLWSKDVSDDVGAEPDTSAQPMYISDDIWVRNDNKASFGAEAGHFLPAVADRNGTRSRLRHDDC